MSRMLWVGIFLVGMVGMARGQVNAFLIYDSSVEPPLTDQCVGGNPIPDGYLVEIYWDADNDGPDADDTPPVVGSGPGECNFNSFLTRGEEFFGQACGFATDPAFSMNTVLEPARFWLRVWTGDEGVCLRSNSFTISGGIHDYFFTHDDFTCLELPCDDCGPLTAPQVVILPQGDDIVLTWNPVDTTTAGCTVDGKDYLVYVSESPDGPYDYLAWTSDTTFTDAGAVAQLAQRYYQVTADKGVQFADPNLEQAVREQLGNFDEPLLREDLESVTDLDAGNRGIQNLSGIQWLKNLEELYLLDNPIGDIAPLSELSRLQLLFLRSSQPLDLTPLSTLYELTHLLISVVSFDQAINIAPLAPLIQLEWLYVVGGQLTDLTPISGLTNLSYLSLLNEPQISDIGPLANLIQLQHLLIVNSQISSVSPLANLGQLTNLDLQGNQLSDICPLGGLTQMQQLNLGNGEISNISALSSLSQLTYLYLGRNQIADTGPLSALTDLTFLDLSFAQITEIDQLANLTQLQTLGLAGNQISDISPLASLAQLRSLALASNQVSEISSLSNLLQLESLILNGNQISDVSSITGLSQVQYIDIGSNQINDLQALVDNQGLNSGDILIADNNPLSETALTVQIPELISRGVNVYYDGAARESDGQGDMYEAGTPESNPLWRLLDDASTPEGKREMLRKEIELRVSKHIEEAKEQSTNHHPKR